MNNTWRDLEVEDPTHVSRVLYDAYGAAKPSSRGQIRVNGRLDIKPTKFRFRLHLGFP